MRRYNLSFYTFVTESQEEQAQIEVKLDAMSIGQKVKKIPTPRYQQLQERIANIVREYYTYVNDTNIMEYLWVPVDLTLLESEKKDSTNQKSISDYSVTRICFVKFKTIW